MPTPTTAHIARGTARVYWCIAIDDHTAPTVAEITAGTDISEGLGQMSGWRLTSNVDLLATAFGDAISLEGAVIIPEIPQLGYYDRGSATAALRSMLAEGQRGYVVYCNYGVPIEGDRVQVWPVIALGPRDAPQVANTPAMFTVRFSVWDRPRDQAEVAA